MGLKPEWQARLETLQECSSALWLAELGAWLHNIGKLRVGTAVNYRHPTGRVLQLLKKQGTEAAAWDELVNSLGWKQPPLHGQLTAACAYYQAQGLPQQWLNESVVELPAPFTRCVVADLIEFQQAFWYQDGAAALAALGLSPSQMLLPHLLQRCHERASNVEREGESNEGLFTPGGARTLVATVFGHDREALTIEEVWQGLGADVSARTTLFADRAEFLKNAPAVLRRYPADPRIPINDVTIGDIGAAVAAFFKAAIVKAVLDGRMEPGRAHGADDATLRFVPLRVGIDEAAVYSRGLRVPDLMGRRQQIADLLDGVRSHVEDKLCLANEVYRDTWGAVFLLPELANADQQQELTGWVRGEIERVWLAAGGWEAMPDIGVGEAHSHGLSVYAAASQAPAPRTDLGKLEEAWQQPGGAAGVCPVCGLHPVGRRRDEVEAKTVCWACQDRRVSRAREWLARGRERTIWMEEAADENGRLCLLGMRFRLEPWLREQDSLIEKTLFVRRLQRKDGRLESDSKVVAKRANFSRQQRLWRTVEEFWRAALGEVTGVLRQRRRLVLQVEPVAESRLQGQLSYVLEREGMSLGVAWDRPGQRFVSAENLDGALRVAGMEGRKAEWLQRWPGRARVTETTGYGLDNRDRGDVVIRQVAEEETRYVPLVEILTRPEEALVIVPAREAWAAARAVAGLYDHEMARVRDRLALEFSFVFADAALPLSALLDGLRRMMRRPASRQQRTVGAVSGPGRNQEWVETLRLPFAERLEWEWRDWCGAAVAPARKLRQADRWYGWLRTDQGLSLARMLEPGARVTVDTSNFDFEMLDGAGDRFALAYDEDGRRRGAERTARPFELERMADFDSCWQVVSSQLHNRQAGQMAALLGEKRGFWPGGADSAVWRQFARDVLGGLEWRDRALYLREQAERLGDAADRGVLEAALELNLKIRKDRTERSQTEAGQTTGPEGRP